ncbi:unnamed protein product [Schistosoma curassoni]|uniref:Rab-GAP TBC domain-containing protein n=1 Tax=Schistosoma curassoni TaxID=6186 RepID=A0A183JKI9_9TREM|nr:unnamed protein product [Schistosoma curassoni]
MGWCLTKFQHGFKNLVCLFGNLRHLWRRRVICLSIKGRVYCAAVRSVLIYGSKTWPLRVEDTRKLLVFEHRCLRNIAGICWDHRVLEMVGRRLGAAKPKRDLNTSGELSLHSDITCEQLNSVEADVFWCTSHLLDTIQDNYTFAQPGLQNNVKMLASLIERIDTKLYQHFIQNDVEFLQFAFRWMNNLLIRELPLRCIIRLWDTYMSENSGFSNFHVYVCAAFLLQFSNDLCREQDFQGIMLLLQHLPTFHWTDENIKLVLAEAFRLHSLFNSAMHHLDFRRHSDLD